MFHGFFHLKNSSKLKTKTKGRYWETGFLQKRKQPKRQRKRKSGIGDTKIIKICPVYVPLTTVNAITMYCTQILTKIEK